MISSRSLVMLLFLTCVFAIGRADVYNLRLTNDRVVTGTPDQLFVDLEISANSGFTLGGNGSSQSDIFITYTNRGTGSGQVIPSTFNSTLSGYSVTMTDDGVGEINIAVKRTGGSHVVSTSYGVIGTLVFDIGGSGSSPTVTLDFNSATTSVKNSGNVEQTQGDFTGVSTAPLPVELGEFGVAQNQGETKLYWTTYSEIENMGFHIESSQDGVHFSDVAFVKGYGNSVQTHHYEFKVEMSQMVTYYRLRQEDFDGTTVYSKVVRVASVSALANPLHVRSTTNGVFVDFGGELQGEPVWKVCDSQGHTVLSGSAQSPVLQIDTQGLKNGIYFFVSTELKAVHQFAVVR